MSLKDYELVGDSPRRFMDSVGAPCIPHTNSGVKLGLERNSHDHIGYNGQWY